MSISTILGFDFGLRKIGVALGQTITQSARPLAILQAKAGVPDWSSIDRLIDEWQPQILVVGIPFDLDATNEHITKAAEAFAEAIEQRYSVPLHRVDERLSSRAAHDLLDSQPDKKRRHTDQIDDIAAMLIVETWMRENQA